MLYRAYFLDESNRIFGFHLLECLDDSDAIAQAQELPAKCNCIEVWEGARLIGRTIRPHPTRELAHTEAPCSSSGPTRMSDEPPRVLMSLAMLELQANRQERAMSLVDEVYAAFDQAAFKANAHPVLEREGHC
jgi:hypothetical protein